jgi:multisubunit Na+/H+ antiporter MnhC subunit
MLNTLFGGQLDAVSLAVLIILGVMSSLSWAIILTHACDRLRWAKQACLIVQEMATLEPTLRFDHLEGVYESSQKAVSLLATIASTAPYVGLFGTVWGIHLTLMAISAKESATLEAVAGPVGQALVMTAVGLGVALPAVWAYNTITKSLSRRFGELERCQYSKMQVST